MDVSKDFREKIRKIIKESLFMKRKVSPEVWKLIDKGIPQILSAIREDVLDEEKLTIIIKKHLDHKKWGEQYRWANKIAKACRKEMLERIDGKDKLD